MTNFNTPMAFQWIKGENLGKFVRSTGKTFNDGLEEYVVFEDGTQCNTKLIGEWVIPMDVPNPSGRKNSESPTPAVQAVPDTATNTTSSVENPVYDLLQKSKKQSTKIRLEITIDMPSDDLIRIVNESYEGGENHIRNYLVSTVNQNSVMSQIEDILGERVKTTVNKKKSTNNENTLRSAQV